MGQRKKKNSMLNGESVKTIKRLSRRGGEGEVEREPVATGNQKGLTEAQQALWWWWWWVLNNSKEDGWKLSWQNLKLSKC